MTGQNSHLLFTVVNLQFKNSTNTSESSLPLLWILCLEEALEGGFWRAAQAADLLCVTDTAVHAEQVHPELCAPELLCVFCTTKSCLQG